MFFFVYLYSKYVTYQFHFRLVKKVLQFFFVLLLWNECWSDRFEKCCLITPISLFSQLWSSEQEGKHTETSSKKKKRFWVCKNWRRQWQPTPILLPGKSHGRLQSMGSQRVRHDWVTSLSFFTFMHWRRKWQPTPVFLPGESQGWEPGGLPSMGSHRVGHNWHDLAAAAACKDYFLSVNFLAITVLFKLLKVSLVVPSTILNE